MPTAVLAHGIALVRDNDVIAAMLEVLDQVIPVYGSGRSYKGGYQEWQRSIFYNGEGNIAVDHKGYGLPDVD
ncbi:MAG: hypothetical protein WCA45_08040, partial [Thiobacillaceae bacterium]